MFWWEDDQEEREQLGEIERMVLSRLAGPYESREEYEWLRRMRIWARPGHPEVLTAGLSSTEARSILESSYGLMGEIASNYERISALFVGEEALVTSAAEFGEMLHCQAARMRGLLEILMPAVELLYRDYGGRGRMWRGVQEALRATESDPTSPVVARGFEYACVICHTLEELDSGAQEQMQQPSEEPTSETRWCQLVWQEVVRAASTVDCEAPASTMRWACLGVAGLGYVDVAERLRCVVERPRDTANAVPTYVSSLRFVARGPQRVWNDYYLAVETDNKLTNWLGNSAYAVASREGLEVWPSHAYHDRLRRMAGSFEGEFYEGDPRIAEWKRLVRAPRAIVGEREVLLPIETMLDHGLPSIGRLGGIGCGNHFVLVLVEQP